MVKSACTDFMKYELFVVNALFFLGGIIVLVIVSYIVLVTLKTDTAEEKNFYHIGFYVSCGILGVIIFVSCLGCSGAIQEFPCLLSYFHLIVLMFFILMFVFGILMYFFYGNLNKSTEERMYTSLKKYGQEQSAYTTTFWDLIQKFFGCCGVNKRQDWHEAKKKYPKSCCKNESSCSGENENDMYAIGCLAMINNFTNSHKIAIYSLGVGILVLALISLIFSKCLLMKIKRKRLRGYINIPNPNPHMVALQAPQ